MMEPSVKARMKADKALKSALEKVNAAIRGDKAKAAEQNNKVQGL